MAGGIPSEVVGVSIGVLLYSVFCLFLSSILVGLLLTYGEKFSYVTINATFTTVSTLASIIQQIYYAAQWEYIKQTQFEKAIRALALPGLTLTGGSTTAEAMLFFIQFWCYNIMSLNVFFWSVDLFTSAWGFRTPWLGEWLLRIGPISKIFSVVFPSFIVGFLHADFVLKSLTATFLIANGTMMITLPAGGILLILILYKYMRTRRLAAGGSRRGGWWASRDSKSQNSRDVGSHYTMSTAITTARTSIYDRALVTRFSIGFVILALFLVAIIIFSYTATLSAVTLLTAGGPNFSIKAAIVDVLLFMPGVTASLTTFLVFGTAKPWRQYRDLLIGGCGIRNRIVQRSFLRQRDEENGPSGEEGVEFASLPSLKITYSGQERTRNEETKKRVQMFAKEVRRSDVGGDIITSEESYRPDTAATLVSHAQQPSITSVASRDGQRSEERKIVISRSERQSFHMRGNSLPPLPAVTRGRPAQFHHPSPSSSTMKSTSSREHYNSQGAVGVGRSGVWDDQVIQSDRVRPGGRR